MVTPDEFPDRDDIELSCAVSGEEMQKARTSDMILPVSELIESISGVTPLRAGDLIFTGTPSGVSDGTHRSRFLRPGDDLSSRAEMIGEMRHRFKVDPR